MTSAEAADAIVSMTRRLVEGAGAGGGDGGGGGGESSTAAVASSGIDGAPLPSSRCLAWIGRCVLTLAAPPERPYSGALSFFFRWGR
eukprot:COSAG04_NODE_5133_length_1725_cov_1.940959_1_plen_87_part_00